MKVRFFPFLLTLFFVLVLIGAPHGWAQTRPEKRGPIITHAFAVESGYYGYIWKIYLEAEDPDGDMMRIASSVHEVGYGNYLPNWSYLKPQYQKKFSGFLQWNTFSSRAGYMPEWTQITLKVSVFDKAGNESNEVIFPFTFQLTPKQYEYKLPAPFDQGDLPRLGYIMIDLFPPYQYGGYGGHFN